MDIDFDNGRMFVADFDKGYVQHYSISTPIGCDSRIDEVSSHQGGTGARVVKYWADRDEIFVGYTGGKICVYQIENLSSGPICKWIKICTIFNFLRLFKNAYS
jgi:hypothetical protein